MKKKISLIVILLLAICFVIGCDIKDNDDFKVETTEKDNNSWYNARDNN